MITTLVQAASTREFAAGLRCGVVAFVAGLVLALMWRTGGDESPAPIGGFLLAAATVIALADTGRLPDGLILGLVALAIGGLLADIAVSPNALDAAQVLSVFDAVTAAPPPTTTTATTTPTTSTTTVPPTTSVPAPTTSIPPAPCTFLNAPIAGRAQALWLLNGHSPNALDSCGHANTATITNAVAYDQVPGPAAASPDDGGVQLDGTSSAIVAPAGVDPATTGTAFSVVSWFKLPSASAGEPSGRRQRPHRRHRHPLPVVVGLRRYRRHLRQLRRRAPWVASAKRRGPRLSCPEPGTSTSAPMTAPRSRPI